MRAIIYFIVLLYKYGVTSILASQSHNRFQILINYKGLQTTCMESFGPATRLPVEPLEGGTETRAHSKSSMK